MVEQIGAFTTYYNPNHSLSNVDFIIRQTYLILKTVGDFMRAVTYLFHFFSNTDTIPFVNDGSNFSFHKRARIDATKLNLVERKLSRRIVLINITGYWTII